jgi:hypothetical protein
MAKVHSTFELRDSEGGIQVCELVENDDRSWTVRLRGSKRNLSTRERPGLAVVDAKVALSGKTARRLHP